MMEAPPLINSNTADIITKPPASTQSGDPNIAPAQPPNYARITWDGLISSYTTVHQPAIIDATRLEPLPEAKLIQELARRYKQLPKVAAIYLEKSPLELVFFCFLNHDQYDDHLMDQLLDIEWELLKDFPDQIFDIHYMPLMVKNQGILSSSAQKIA